MSDGVTVVVTRTIKPGRDQDCEAWLHDVSAVATRFPGHLGITIFRPPRGSRQYTFAFRFQSEDQLEAWERSTERATWVARADAFTETASVHRHTGLETWFARSDGAMPPRWKMVVVSWLVAFPLIQVFARTLGVVALPALLRGALVGLAMVVTMTYAAMPLATRVLRRWLY